MEAEDLYDKKKNTKANVKLTLSPIYVTTLDIRVYGLLSNNFEYPHNVQRAGKHSLLHPVQNIN